MNLPIKAIYLPGGIKVTILDVPTGLKKAATSSELREQCPFCNDPDCYFHCDQSQIDEEIYDYEDGTALSETEEEVVERLAWNAAIDGLEFLISACASKGVDVESKNFHDAVALTLHKIKNCYW